MTMPTREQMFAALAPQTPEDHAALERERAEVGRQHAVGLRLAQIVALASPTRIAALVHSPLLTAMDTTDPAAAEHIRDVCHRRLIELSTSH